MEISESIVRHKVVLGVALLVVLGVMWRLMPHLPNFAPIGAIALISGLTLGWKRGLALTFGILLITDSMIGFYSGFGWTWFSFALIIGLGLALRKLPVSLHVPIGVFGASVVFFIVSNFGVWAASGMYEHTLAGLVRCYTMALPFFRATLLSDVMFGSTLMGLYYAVRLYPSLPHSRKVSSVTSSLTI